MREVCSVVLVVLLSLRAAHWDSVDLDNTSAEVFSSDKFQDPVRSPMSVLGLACLNPN